MAKPKDETPPANEFGQLRSYLAQQGFSQSWINSVIGTTNDKTRAEIVDLLRDAMKELPKG